MADCNSYPKFEPNQVLTAEQLNHLSDFLRNSDLRTRANVIGIGPVCGLEVIFASGAAPSLTITSGIGITSEGYLIEVDDYTATRYLSYQDPLFYPPFWPGAGQVQLLELRSTADTETGDGSKPLTAEFLKTKAVLLYLECKDIDLETCTGEDCDERGIRVELCVKRLLIEQSELQKIIAGAYGLAQNIDLDQFFNARFDLPELRIGREAGLLKLGDSVAFSDLVQLYTKMLSKPVLNALGVAYQKSYEAYARYLSDEFSVNPFNSSSLRDRFIKRVSDHAQHIQYVYDYFKDLVMAYEEFKAAAFGLRAECCPDDRLFAKHLMLGPAAGPAECRPSVYRRNFIPATLYGDHEQRLEKVRMLFQRMKLLVDYFEVPPYQKGQIKITPSREKGTPLSLRSIPYYYAPQKGIHDYWNDELRRRCKTDHMLSYHAGQWAPATLPHVVNPIAFNCDPFPFLRIEGHIGGAFADSAVALEEFINEFNLPFKFIGLSLKGKVELRRAEAVRLEDQQQRIKLALDLLKLSPAEFDQFVRQEKSLSRLSPADTAKVAPSAAKSPIADPREVLRPADSALVPAERVGITAAAETPAEAATILGCRFEDLEAIYISCRGALICLLQREVDFFTDLKIGTKAPTYEAGNNGIKGSIVDILGAPVPGAEVLVLDKWSNKAVTKVQSDETGKFQMQELNPDDYYLAVKYNNLEIMRDLVSVKSGQDLGVDILFEADPEVLQKAAKGAAPKAVRSIQMAGLAVKSDQAPGSAASKSGDPTALSGAEKTGGGFSEIPSPILDRSRGRVIEEPQVKTVARREVFLDKSLEKPASRNTIGQFLKESKASDLRPDSLDFAYEYYKRYPYLDKAAIPESFAREINAPINLIDAVNAVVEVMAETLKAFNLPLFEQRYADMVKTAVTFKAEIVDDLNDPSTKPRGDEQEIIRHLDYLIEDCSPEKLQVLVAVYQQRVLEVQKLERFANFARLHPGLEHQAGVPKGGTFIVVYDEKQQVVADFALPYICCSDCPPITTVCAATPLIFKLPRDKFCTGDETEYKFMISHPGGNIIPNDIVRCDETTGDFWFSPGHKDVQAGDLAFEYQVEGLTAGLVVSIMEVTAEIDHQIINLDRANNRATVQFKAAPADAAAYQWDFGDDGSATEAAPEHEFDISETDTFTVKLVLTKDGCSSEATLALDLVECSAGFSFEVVSQTGTTARVQFTATYQDQESYQWNFGDDQTAADANPVHDFDLAETRSFSVTLAAAKGECTDQQSQALSFEACTADFSHIISQLDSKTARVEFTAGMADADEYAWDFGDGQASDERAPVHDYDIIELQSFTAKLKVKRGICADEQEQAITFDVCRADFSHKLVERDADTAQVQFTADMADADSYEWDFGNGQTSNLSNPVISFNLASARTFTVTLHVTNGSCEDQQEQALEFEVCSADFSHEILQPAGQTVRVRFTAQMPDADSYVWDFGDGSSGEGATPEHPYDIREVQSFNVSLTVKKGDCQDQQTRQVEFDTCTAEFTHQAVRQRPLSSELQFTPAMTDATATYQWNFGDNSPVVGQESPRHIFNTSERRSFNVELSVVKGNCQDTQEKQISIDPCSADFTFQVTPRDRKSVTVAFEPVIKDAKNYLWQFSGGAPDSKASSPKIVFNITEIQTYRVSLTIQKGPCQAQREKLIGLAACSAAFDYQVTALGSKSIKVRFNAQLPDADEYIWEFGDDRKGSGRNPEHAYDLRLGRQFEVRLTVTKNAADCRDVQTLSIDFESDIL